jgi:hypothetical protein
MEEPPLKLLIACHVHDSVTPAFCQAYAKAMTELALAGVPINFVLFKDSDVSRGRNRAVHAMLHHNYTHLLFVDADIDFTADDVMALLNLHEDVAVGPYRKKNERCEYNFEFIPAPDNSVTVNHATGAVEVMRAGTGFMMIRRAVFEKMREAMPEIVYLDRTDKGEDFETAAYFVFEIRETPWGPRQFSEDFNFCERWRAIGGRIWMAPNLKLSHWGAHEWKGDLEADGFLAEPDDAQIEARCKS